MGTHECTPGGNHLPLQGQGGKGQEDLPLSFIFSPPPFCLYQTVIEVFNSARMEKQCQFLLEPPPPIAETGNPPPSQGWKVFLCQSHHTSAFSGELSHPAATHCQNLGTYSKHPGLHQGLMKPKTTRYTSRA